MTLDDSRLAAALARALPAARWFAGKASAIDRVTLHDGVALADDAGLAIALADVALAGPGLADAGLPRGEPQQRYLVVVGRQGDDAAGTAAFGRWLIETVLAGHEVPGRAGMFVGHPTNPGGHGLPATAAAPTVTPVGGDASNSSFLVRTDTASWIVKLFRRSRTGINPEVEVGEFFATASPWAGTPRFCGWLSYEERDPAEKPLAAAGAVTAIATVHAFAPDCTTAWDRLLGLVSATPAGAAAETVFTIAAAIGRATGRMHRALASRPDIPAFAPERPSAGSWRAVAAGMVADAERVFSLIASRLPDVGPALAGRLEAVLAARGRLLGRFDAIAGLAAAADNIRVHGDYHLGQVLVAEREGRSLVAEREGQSLVAEHESHVLVIDFEGEPGRTLAERRQKTSAAKDVAGMCRSFDYFLRQVAKTTGRPYDVADLRRLESRFLDAYCRESAGQAWWPADNAVAETLLKAYRLDKAIYELAYELNNRPAWIDVPLAAVEEAAAV